MESRMLLQMHVNRFCVLCVDLCSLMCVMTESLGARSLWRKRGRLPLVALVEQLLGDAPLLDTLLSVGNVPRANLGAPSCLHEVASHSLG